MRIPTRASEGISSRSSPKLFGPISEGEIIHARHVAARPIEGGNEAKLDRIVCDGEQNGDRGSRGLRRARCGGGGCDKHIYPLLGEIGS
jgi:hypothetical protein